MKFSDYKYKDYANDVDDVHCTVDNRDDSWYLVIINIKIMLTMLMMQTIGMIVDI